MRSEVASEQMNNAACCPFGISCLRPVGPCNGLVSLISNPVGLLYQTNLRGTLLQACAPTELLKLSYAVSTSSVCFLIKCQLLSSVLGNARTKPFCSGGKTIRRHSLTSSIRSSVHNDHRCLPSQVYPYLLEKNEQTW